VETIDLSSLSEKREFKKEITLGKETGRLIVHFNPPDSCYISVKYHPYRGFERSYRLKEVPASLTRGLVRLGASDAYMLRLQAVYAEILAQVSEVGHDQLHTDNPEYDS
jgi:hypothetical protein